MKFKKITIIALFSFILIFSSNSALAVLTLDDTSVVSNGVLTLTSASTVILNGRVGIGTTTPGTFTQLEVYNAGAPDISLASGRSASSSSIGSWSWNALNSAAAKTNYSYLSGRINTNTAGLETGSIEFRTLVAGADTVVMKINSGNVGIGTTTPNANAALDISSTTKAFMPPRMTTVQRNAIASPTAGMMIYNTTTNKLNVYTTTWEEVTSQ